MWARVEERSLGATFAREASVAGEIWRRPLRRRSKRLVRRKFWRRGKRVGDETVSGRMGRVVELGALAGRVGSEVQYAAIRRACVGYSKGASADDFDDDRARIWVGRRLFCEGGGMFRLMRCEDGTARGSMGIILFTAEHILEFRVSGCSGRVEIDNSRLAHVSETALDIFYWDICELWLDGSDSIWRRVFELGPRQGPGELDGARSIKLLGHGGTWAERNVDWV